MFDLKIESKFTKVSLTLICSLFFITCIYSFYKLGDSALLGSLETFNNDDVKYIRSAWTLIEKGIFSYKYPDQSTVFIMPGLTYVLAFFTLLFGKMSGILAFKVFQAILQVLSLLLVFFIGRKIFNSKTGLIAAFINAVYLPEVWVSNIILTEAIFKLLLLCLIYFSIYAVEEKKLKYYIAGGIFYGVSAMFRPTIALFPIVILVAWIRSKYTVKEMIKYTCVVVIIFCTILSPWWIRNALVFHRFIPFTLATGNPMLQGTYLNYDDNLDETENIKYPNLKYTDNDEIENNRIEVEKAKIRISNAIHTRPLEYAYWYTIGKTKYQWKVPFYWLDIFGVNWRYVTKLHKAILWFAFAGIILTIFNRKKRPAKGLLAGTVIYFNCIYLPFFCFCRYMYPVMPFIILYAGYAIFKISSIAYLQISKVEGMSI